MYRKNWWLWFDQMLFYIIFVKKKPCSYPKILNVNVYILWSLKSYYLMQFCFSIKKKKKKYLVLRMLIVINKIIANKSVNHIMSVNLISRLYTGCSQWESSRRRRLINVTWCCKRTTCTLSSVPASINTAVLLQISLKHLCKTSAVRFHNR